MRMTTMPIDTGRATIVDLERIDGKAELIDGRIVRFMPTGDLPGYVGGRIFRKLADHVDALGYGRAWPDGVGFVVPELSSGRESFSPDVAFHKGPLANAPMKFVDGAPTFAVEVRSQNDYTPAAEREIVDKRNDYFEAGTLAVWDVDPIAETVTCYRHDTPDQPISFSRGEIANAEPAVPGWTLDTEWLFKQP
jgi:Uma2 family endonuclease